MSEEDFFAKIVKGLKPLIILANGLVFDVWLDSEFTFEFT